MNVSWWKMEPKVIFLILNSTTLRMIQSQGGIVGWVTTANRLTDSLRQAYG